jgi:hypothetical protein
MSKYLCRTVCTVLQVFLEKGCHACWVRSYMRPSPGGKYQYILLLKDDLSGYLWLVSCRAADAAATVDALMRWFSVFDIVLLWISPRQPL